MASYFKSKRVLVAGGSGMIGRPLVRMLNELGASVLVASLDDPKRAPSNCDFTHVDLRDLNACVDVCRGIDVVFNLAGVKGSPNMTVEHPASFFVPTIMFSINLMEAARRAGVDRYLYTSSIGVYAPAETFHEDDVWKTFPSVNDRFAGWAKRMGELQAEAYRIEHGWDGVSIVRPANVYGEYDNFDLKSSMVIPSLIRRVVDGERPLKVWGDGTPVRDFIHADDVARGMLTVVEKKYTLPVNLGSGVGVTIRQLAETIARHVYGVDVIWDDSRGSGDARRLMDTTRAQSLGINPMISLDEGIARAISYYRQDRDSAISGKYNAFREIP